MFLIVKIRQMSEMTQSLLEVSLFDTHCHFDFAPFTAEPELELQRAAEQGVKRLLIPSVGPQDWQAVAELAQRFPSTIYYALGFHPLYLDSSSPAHLPELEKALMKAEHACVAVGECGLDGMINVDAQLQEQMLIAQLALASQARLPVILHSRRTHNRLLQLLKQQRFQQGGVLHAFSGSLQEAHQFVDLGFKIGVGGVITYPRANKTRQAIAALATEHLVLETDAPDMPLNGFQGQANHPAQLTKVLETLAQLKDVSVESLAPILWQTSQTVFGLCKQNQNKM
ncbi:Putative deoxyribonuclease yjjV [Vibrio mimicus VM603]|uniref:Putative deoxyribonuclease yjjV n=2 Tax=Vibrio mimicus TaxID=674 RepID=D2Y9C8_VIBMI|nr:TatD family deoxyribonuclease [Vibrio mimicus]EEW08654.1 Putative deoxyribonuclease yjjV [Vibrio mimicus VM603]KAA3492694.1 TatD family deoxyribonuclease [Vibrio mimicus]TXY06769.1 TatD family deoxyribonuclease [Vibrio mimicus]